MYADEFIIYYSRHKIKFVERLIQNIINDLDDWAKSQGFTSSVFKRHSNTPNLQIGSIQMENTNALIRLRRYNILQCCPYYTKKTKTKKNTKYFKI